MAGTSDLDGDLTPGANFSSSSVTANTNADDTTDSKTVIGSVLERANLFECLEKQQKEKPAAVRGESIYGRRDDVAAYKSTSNSERDSGKRPVQIP